MSSLHKPTLAQDVEPAPAVDADAAARQWLEDLLERGDRASGISLESIEAGSTSAPSKQRVKQPANGTKKR